MSNIDKNLEYKVENFFSQNNQLPSTPNANSRNVEETNVGLSINLPRNVLNQIQTLAEAEGQTIQDLSSKILIEYAENNYLEYVKNLINSLPKEHRDKVLFQLRNY